MKTFDELLSAEVSAAVRLEADQVDSAIAAAVHAHLPVSHVAFHDGLLSDDYVRRWEVVLPGDVVFASGAVRMVGR